MNKNSVPRGIQFVRNKYTPEIDNLYIGTIESVDRLAQHFNTNLDDICNRNQTVGHQERLVFSENAVLFEIPQPVAKPVGFFRTLRLLRR
jgi:hypothetical protein